MTKTAPPRANEPAAATETQAKPAAEASRPKVLEMPREGGSFTRQPDGSLARNQDSAEEAQ